MPNIIRKTFPRIREVSKHGQTYYRVDCRHKHNTGPGTKQFPDVEMAKKFADEFAAQIAQKGFDIIRPIQDPRMAKFEEQCRLYGHTPEEAIAVACRHWFDEAAIKQSKLMSELLALWQSDKETGRKKQRPKSLKTIKDFVKSFTAYFGNYRIKEVNEDLIDAYLKSKLTEDGQPIEPVTQKNHLRYLQGFFNWAKFKNYNTTNPANHWLKEIVVPKTTVDFYSVAQCTEILRKVLLPENERMIGYYAICLFAGARPEETEKLTWEKNVKWDTKEIFIPAHIAKTKADRQFVMPEPLYSWLAIVKEKDLPLIPAKNLRKLKDKVVGNVSFEKIADGLRHTFATFMYAKTRNYETLKSIMGNSPAIIQRHYKGTVDAAEIEKFFNLTPQYVNEHNPKEKIARYKKVLAEKEAAVKLKLPEGAAKQKVKDYLAKQKQIPVAV